MHTLPKLPYSLDALEPHMDAKTMEIHHGKHHAGYVTKLNTALKKYPDLQDKKLKDLLSNLNAIPKEIRTAVRNNGGGHANHSLFWNILSADSGEQPGGKLAQAIKNELMSFEEFKKQFSNLAGARFGSGWMWLVVDKEKRLKLYSTANQDSPLSGGHVPILGLDVWEHAYYLKYQNKRPDYIAAFWKIVNWSEVEKKYEKATNK